MPNRRQKPAELPPNPALLKAYLRDAQPTASDVRIDGAAAVDVQRVKAVRALHTLWRQWKADIARVCAGELTWPEEIEALRLLREHWIAKLGAPNDFDFELRNFFDRAGRVIFLNPDPLAAMHTFWEGAPRRGRRAEANAERDFALAVAVQERVNAGATREAAIAAVAAEARLSHEAIHKIYYRHRLDARADVALREIWRNADQ